MKNIFILGVTGVIGSGKSTLCKFLQDHHNFHWLDADRVVHGLYCIGGPGYKKIKEYFGDFYVGPAAVHRGRLRRFLLKTPQKLWIANKLIHPLVVHEVRKEIQKLKGKRIIIESIYFEPTDLGKLIDKLFIVDASDDLIVRRLKKRKIPMTQLKTLLNFQRKHLPRKEGVIINNNTMLKNFLKSAYDKVNTL